MNDKELSRLNRKELLQMLVDISEENDTLKKRVQELEHKLDNRTIELSEAGNIAEAALKINDVFATAQKCADDYLHSVKVLGTRYMQLCEQRYDEADAIKKKAEEESRAMKEEAENAIDARYSAIETKLQNVYSDYMELQKTLSDLKQNRK